MTFKIIGISGKAGSGKDTAADHIIHLRPAYQKASFADPIKAMLRVGLGLTDAQLWGSKKDVVDEVYGYSPRTMLQTIGTQWGRNYVNWVLAMEAHFNKIGGMFVIPDVRFENEADFIRKHGTLIHIKGLATIANSSHRSEDGVDTHGEDYNIDNVGGMVEYLEQVELVLSRIEYDNQISC